MVVIPQSACVFFFHWSLDLYLKINISGLWNFSQYTFFLV